MKLACSLDLAKHLKTLGVKQESHFWWVNVKTENRSNDAWFLLDDDDPYQDGAETYSAFTADELGQMLPNYVLTPDPEPFNGYRIYLEKFISIEKGSQINNWIVNYHCDTVEGYGKNEFFVRRLTNNIYDPSLANAMAKMVIYLSERGLISHS